MKVRVVGDRLLVDMFRVLGVAGRTPGNEEETETAIRGFMEEPGVGLVLVGGTHAAMLGPRFRDYVQRRELPVVLPVPDRGEQKGCAAEIKEYLQRALGVRL
jgi:vacuolar-type H+-ATPase subunit F/Vma7